MGGIGAAAGPLLGGLITTAISWRAAFLFQVLLVAIILWLARRVPDPLPADPHRPFDILGAVLSAVGLVLLVMGILAVDNNLWLALALVAGGVLFLTWFFLSVRAKERAGKEPLLSSSLFRNRTSNRGLVTQNIQWMLLMGVSFVAAAYLQVVRGHDAIETGIIFTAETVGLLLSSLAAGRLAQRFSQKTLILAGFVLTIGGMLLLIVMVSDNSSVWAFAPGLFLIGVGLGAMLTASVNVVQSSFVETQQGEISGLSRSVSNLGSSLGTAIAGTVLVAGIASTPERSYALAMAVLAAFGVVGLIAAMMLPRTITPAKKSDPVPRVVPPPAAVTGAGTDQGEQGHLSWIDAAQGLLLRGWRGELPRGPGPLVTGACRLGSAWWRAAVQPVVAVASRRWGWFGRGASQSRQSCRRRCRGARPAAIRSAHRSNDQVNSPGKSFSTLTAAASTPPNSWPTPRTPYRPFNQSGEPACAGTTRHQNHSSRPSKRNSKRQDNTYYERHKCTLKSTPM